MEAVNCVLAADLGGTMLRLGWWQDGEMRQTLTAKTELMRGAEGVIDQIVALALGADMPPVSRLVLATAGTLDARTGFVHHSANLPFEAVPLRQLLSQRMDVPVIVIGDAEAAALGEFCVGSAAGANEGLFVTVSTGIGMGIVFQGRLASGTTSQPGELGHITVDLSEQAPLCRCGQRGCLETYAAGTGLVARFRDAVGVSVQQHELSARDVLEAASLGHQPAADLVQRGADLLGAALAAMVRVFAPEALVLGGGLTNSPYYVALIRHRFEDIFEASQPAAGSLLRLARCQPNSGLVGAALLGSGHPKAIELIQGSSLAKQLYEADE